MKALADYVHSKGLKFGVYSDSGNKTCQGLPGSRHFETKDAQTYAQWGVDYLKYDNCFVDNGDWVVNRYTAMRDALNKTGRPIFYSMGEWGVESPWLWAEDVGNSWRTDGDISDNWDSLLRCTDNVVGLSRFAGISAWNDPDILQVGLGGMSVLEYSAQMA